MEPTEKEKQVYDLLGQLEISFKQHHHPAVYTVEQAKKHWSEIKGTHCKNLFLRNKKGNRHYLVILEANKAADLKGLRKKLGEDGLSFASPERLEKHLKLEPGAVSPFGLINDHENLVRVVIDKDLKTAETVNFHPNVNTATVGFSFADFERFLEWTKNPVQYLLIS
ncbi:MAG: prolyl-tRNA synthetase associated domain-containing protein [Candidatus Aminicenantes bacterium]|nr:prolyl-tRNA synthetase associated domain-containing protein [Candidatus Aminicenantes bacterium]